MDMLRDLKNHLIYDCLFATPDVLADPLEILTATKRPPVPKCMTGGCRQAAFNLLLNMSYNNPQLWNEILIDLQEIHDKRMNEVDVCCICCIAHCHIDTLCLFFVQMLLYVVCHRDILCDGNR